MREAGGDAIALCADVTDEQQVAAMLAQVQHGAAALRLPSHHALVLLVRTHVAGPPRGAARLSHISAAWTAS